MCTAGQRSFETEISVTLSKGSNLFEHQLPCSERCSIRIERRNAGRNEIGVHEVAAVRIIRKKLARKRRFPGSIRTGDDIDIGTRGHVRIL